MSNIDNQNSLLDTLQNKLWIFNEQMFFNLQKNNITRNSSLKKLQYWEKNWLVYRLKKWLYIVKKSKVNVYRIANELYTPSYISLDTILSIYSIIPDLVLNIYSVTTKDKKEFNNDYGNFIYKTLKKDYFDFWFEKKGKGNDIYYIALPEKALLDFLYFRMKEINISQNLISQIIKWDLNNLDKKKLKKVFDWFSAFRFSNLDELNFNLIYEYSNKFNKKKLLCLIKLLDYYKSTDYYDDYL